MSTRDVLGMIAIGAAVLAYTGHSGGEIVIYAALAWAFMSAFNFWLS